MLEHIIREGRSRRREFVAGINAFFELSETPGTEVVVVANNVPSTDGSGAFFVRVRGKPATLT